MCIDFQMRLKCPSSILYKLQILSFTLIIKKDRVKSGKIRKQDRATILLLLLSERNGCICYRQNNTISSMIALMFNFGHYTIHLISCNESIMG